VTRIRVHRVIFIHPGSIPPPGAKPADPFTEAIARDYYARNQDPALAHLGPTPERSLCVMLFVGEEY
jgi:hypothetical protein